MVFRKLTIEQKEEIAQFAAELNPALVSSVRALTMRGYTPDEAKKKVLERGVDDVAKPKATRRKKDEAIEVTVTVEEQAKPKQKAKAKAAATEVGEQVIPNKATKPKQKAKSVDKVEVDEPAKKVKQPKRKTKAIGDTEMEPVEADAIIKF